MARSLGSLPAPPGYTAPMQLPPTAPALAPYVQYFWATAPQPSGPGWRERMLPNGQMHLAVRLDGSGVRLFANATDTAGARVAHAIVAGIRDRPYLKDISEASRSVGALLLPGAARALLGCSAEELSNRHVPLDAIAGRDAGTLYQRLLEANSPAHQIVLLQAFLLRRLQPVRGLHPPIARAIAALRDGGGVAALVSASGYSHKRFIALFREQTGLAPKSFARVQRLQQVLRAPLHCPLAELAQQAGYSDQAHLQREFLALTGLTPQAWRRAGGTELHHVPIVPGAGA